MSFAAIDMSLLTAPTVVETLDAEAIVAALKADLVARLPEAEDVLALESEPIVKLLEVAAYRETLLRARVNEAAKSVMVAFARGSDLDHLAALVPLQRFAGESDADFRARVQLAPAGFSVAGPSSAYVFHALSAGGTPETVEVGSVKAGEVTVTFRFDPVSPAALIKDATATSPAPGVVEVTVLGRAGDGAVDQATLDLVTAALGEEDVRPLTDQVTVLGAMIVNYQVIATLTLLPGPDAETVRAAAEAAVQAYADAQHRLGRDITLSALFAALHQPGVEKVTLTSPVADIAVAETQAAYMTALTVTVGGA